MIGSRLALMSALSLTLILAGCAKKKTPPAAPARGKVVGTAQLSRSVSLKWEDDFNFRSEKHCLQPVRLTNGETVIEITGEKCPKGNTLSSAPVIETLRLRDELNPDVAGNNETFLMKGSRPTMDLNAPVAWVFNKSLSVATELNLEVDFVCQKRGFYDLSRVCAAKFEKGMLTMLATDVSESMSRIASRMGETHLQNAEDIKKEHSEIKKSLVAVQEEIVGIHGKIRALNTEIGTAKMDMTLLEQRIGTAEGKEINLTTALNKLDERLVAINAEHVKTKKVVDAFELESRGKFTTARTEIANLNIAIAATGTEIKNRETELDGLKKKVAEFLGKEWKEFVEQKVQEQLDKAVATLNAVKTLRDEIKIPELQKDIDKVIETLEKIKVLKVEINLAKTLEESEALRLALVARLNEIANVKTKFEAMLKEVADLNADADKKHKAEMEARKKDFLDTDKLRSDSAEPHKTEIDARKKDIADTDKLRADSAAPHKTEMDARKKDVADTDKLRADSAEPHKTEMDARKKDIADTDKSRTDSAAPHKTEMDARKKDVVDADKLRADSAEPHKTEMDARKKDIADTDKSRTDSAAPHKTEMDARKKDIKDVELALSHGAGGHKTQIDGRIKDIADVDKARVDSAGHHKTDIDARKKEIETRQTQIDDLKKALAEIQTALTVAAKDLKDFNDGEWKKFKDEKVKESLEAAVKNASDLKVLRDELKVEALKPHVDALIARYGDLKKAIDAQDPKAGENLDNVSAKLRMVKEASVATQTELAKALKATSEADKSAATTISDLRAKITELDKAAKEAETAIKKAEAARLEEEKKAAEKKAADEAAAAKDAANPTPKTFQEAQREIIEQLKLDAQERTLDELRRQISERVGN